MTISILGIPVEFPYEPYPCQVNYMESVIRCLQNGLNGALESPTGTGKTLCLLCACLGWLQVEKSKFLVNELIPNAMLGVSKAKDIDNGWASKIDQSKSAYFSTPKIIYASRTHSQIAQVVKELNKTSYRTTVNVCLLGSRDLLCINTEVQKEENNSVKNSMCRTKVKHRSCMFFNNFESGKYAKDSFRKEDGVLDIEDIVSFGNRTRVCPFYKARENQQTADIILLPYNYILDPAARRSNNIELKGNIVIFDEAHNLQKICEDISSAVFTTKDVALCIKESKEALCQIQEQIEAIRKERDQSDAAFGEVFSVDKESPAIRNININEVSHMIVMLHKLEEELEVLASELREKQATPASGPFSTLSGLIKEGQTMLDILLRAGIKPHFRDPLILLIDSLVTYFAEKVGNSAWHSRGTALQKFSLLLSTVFGNAVTNLSEEVAETQLSQRCFKLFVNSDQSASFMANSDSLAAKASSSSHVNLNMALNYWCFSAGPGMRSLLRQGLRCVIVTSGTLSPLPAFIDELNIPVNVTLENPHIVEQRQVWAGIVSNCANNTAINGSFVNRNSVSYLDGLGETILDIVKLVPGGVLVFFASYSQMDCCNAHWKNSGIWKKLNDVKQVFYEPKSKDQLSICMSEYKMKVEQQQSGAIFMAVCRGKLSEGIDFSDAHARAVIIAGIPYPPAFDPKVLLKKEFLNEAGCAQLSSMNTQKKLTAGQWYTLEAVRAVNQAAGRAIRHKNDFGAIIFADSRFASLETSQFSSWLRPLLKKYVKFDDVRKSLSTFFGSVSHDSKYSSPLVSSSNTVVKKVTTRCRSPVDEKSNHDSSTNDHDVTVMADMYKRPEVISTKAALYCENRPSCSSALDALNEDEKLHNFPAVQNPSLDILPSTLAKSLPVCSKQLPQHRKKIKLTANVPLAKPKVALPSCATPTSAVNVKPSVEESTWLQTFKGPRRLSTESILEKLYEEEEMHVKKVETVGGPSNLITPSTLKKQNTNGRTTELEKTEAVENSHVPDHPKVLSHADYMDLVKSLPDGANLQARLLKVVLSYTKTSAFDTLVRELAALFLPQYPQAFAGFFAFVKPEHKPKFLQLYCELIAKRHN